jgi:hypothetical protein
LCVDFRFSVQISSWSCISSRDSSHQCWQRRNGKVSQSKQGKIKSKPYNSISCIYIYTHTHTHTHTLNTHIH